jgi:hypothetical protein
MFLARNAQCRIGQRPETAVLPESRAALVPPHAQITCGAWPGRMARATPVLPSVYVSSVASPSHTEPKQAPGCNRCKARRLRIRYPEE